MFWMGDDEMNAKRKACIRQFERVSECGVRLVTPANLHEYVVKGYPLHAAYPHLSKVHKSDYLRTYFMHLHGGGYSDVKRTRGSWIPAFEELRRSTSHWIVGYPEIKGGVAYRPLARKWRELVGNNAYVCRPRTKLTKAWFDAMHALLDEKLHKLRRYPATSTRDHAKRKGSKYPIEWNEMLGRIFHRVTYEHRAHVLRTLPTCILRDYK